MRLQDHSLDNLHLGALAELDRDPHAERLLNELYASFVREYVETLLDLRDRAE